MNDDVRFILASALGQAGRDVLGDVRRTEALLKDVCPQWPRERNVIVAALRAGVATDLLASRGGNDAALLTRLVRRLQDEHAIDPGAARWAVETLAEGFRASAVPHRPPPGRSDPSLGDLLKMPRSSARVRGSHGPALGDAPRASDSVSAPGTLGGFLPIEPGTFTMGSPEDEAGRWRAELRRKVTVARRFWMKATLVTQAEYASVTKHHPSHFTNSGASAPVERVSWNDTVAYLNTLSDRDGLQRAYDDAGKFLGLHSTGYRLPTEAEWEYACRAGDTGARHGAAERIAWYSVNAAASTHPVASKEANRWGLYDMLGNVWEWINDWHADYVPGDAVDPIGPTHGDVRVIRGGCFDSREACIRAAQRGAARPNLAAARIGFRIARTM